MNSAPYAWRGLTGREAAERWPPSPLPRGVRESWLAQLRYWLTGLVRPRARARVNARLARL